MFDVRLIQVFGSLPPDAQRILVEKHLASLLDLVPKDRSKKSGVRYNLRFFGFLTGIVCSLACRDATSTTIPRRAKVGFEGEAKANRGASRRAHARRESIVCQGTKQPGGTPCRNRPQSGVLDQRYLDRGI